MNGKYKYYIWMYKKWNNKLKYIILLWKSNCFLRSFYSICRSFFHIWSYFTYNAFLFLRFWFDCSGAIYVGWHFYPENAHFNTDSVNKNSYYTKIDFSFVKIEILHVLPKKFSFVCCRWILQLYRYITRRLSYQADLILCFFLIKQANVRWYLKESI